MALAHCSSFGARVKAVMLVLMAVAAAAASIDEPASVAKAGRFSETPLGRKLLNFNWCGSGTAPNFNCAAIIPFANKPTCCTGPLGTRACFDVGSILLDKCGSCTTVCPFGSICCSGVCANLLSTDKNNCGKCGRKCPGDLPCQFGLCGYGKI